MPDLDRTIFEAQLDSKRNLNEQHIKDKKAAQVLMTFQVVYESVIQLLYKQFFEQYLITEQLVVDEAN